MARDIHDLKEQLRKYRFEYDLLQKLPCSKEENSAYAQLVKEGAELPEGVYAYVYDNGETSSTEFYTVYEVPLTETEKAEYLMYRKLKLLKSIRNGILFFVVLTIVSFLFAILMAQ